MTLGIDSANALSWGLNRSIVPVGTIRGVLILVIDNAQSTDRVTGVDINGVAMTEVAGSPYNPGLTEPCVIHGFFMGSSIPGGTLDVDMNSGGVIADGDSQTQVIYVAFTAANDTEIVDTSTAAAASGTNPTVTVNGNAGGVFAVGALQSNAGVATSLNPGSGYTQINRGDFGNQIFSFEHSTSINTTTPTFAVAWSFATSDDYGILAATVREIAAVTGTANQANETDLAQTIAWAPKHRLVDQALSTELAQTVTPTTENEVLVAQVEETDLAQQIRAAHTVTAVQANEFDIAQSVNHVKVRSIAQVTETDSAQAITAIFPQILGQAIETDQAFAITAFSSMEQAIEFDRAQQITVIGATLPVAEAPVLIRAPRKAGRIFHEFTGGGDAYHPTVGEWEATEDAPGGFRGAKGLIPERVYNAHREVFRAGATWRTFLDDGTCIFAGKLKQPDPQGSIVELSADGRAVIADKVIGPILYQAHVGSELAQLIDERRRWRAQFTTMSHTNVDTGIQFTRSSDPEDSGAANVIIPFFGRELAELSFHLQGSRAELTIFSAFRQRNPSLLTSQPTAELDMSNLVSNWFIHIGTVSPSYDRVRIDLTLADGNVGVPNDHPYNFTNFGDVADAGVGIVYPDIILFQLDDWTGVTQSDDEQEILVSDIVVNGSPVGRSRRYDVGDLVEDIAARLGFKEFRTGGSYGVLPYEIPPGGSAAEALDWASLVSGRRWRILDNGSHGIFEFDWWHHHTWALASPWSPLRTIPEERYDAVAVPYSYPGTHGQLTDHVVVRVEDSPIAKRVNWNIDLPDPAHNRDKAIDLGARIADDLVRPRFSGDFSAAEIYGPDGQKFSAHHINAGDILQPWRKAEPGRLRIGRLTRFEDHVEGEFDGEDRALTKLLERRAKRIGDRKR